MRPQPAPAPTLFPHNTMFVVQHTPRGAFVLFDMKNETEWPIAELYHDMRFLAHLPEKEFAERFSLSEKGSLLSLRFGEGAPPFFVTEHGEVVELWHIAGRCKLEYILHLN